MVTQVRSGLSGLGGTALLLSISPTLTGLSLAVMPAVGIGAVLYGRYVKRLSKSAQSALGPDLPACRSPPPPPPQPSAAAPPPQSPASVHQCLQLNALGCGRGCGGVGIGAAGFNKDGQALQRRGARAAGLRQVHRQNIWSAPVPTPAPALFARADSLCWPADISQEMALASGANMGIVTLGVNTALLAVLYYGGTLVLDGQLSVGDLTGKHRKVSRKVSRWQCRHLRSPCRSGVLTQLGLVGCVGAAAFSLYSLFVGGSATGLTQSYADLMQAAGAAERVFELTHPTGNQDEEDRRRRARQGPELAPELLEPSDAFGELAFKNVEFAYPTRPGAAVLQGLTLTVAPGQMVAVVGSSGSGKSTLLALLTGQTSSSTLRFLSTLPTFLICTASFAQTSEISQIPCGLLQISPLSEYVVVSIFA